MAVAERAQLLQDQGDSVAALLSRLGSCYCDLGEAGRAREMLERALAIQERRFGREHAKVAEGVTALAVTIQ